MAISIYIDGSPKGIGIYVPDYPELCMHKEVYNLTNNEAEIAALAYCLQKVVYWLNKDDVIHIKSDSRLLVNSFKGRPIKVHGNEVFVKKPELLSLLAWAREEYSRRIQDGYKIQIKWIPRRYNKADELSRGDKSE